MAQSWMTDFPRRTWGRWEEHWVFNLRKHQEFENKEEKPQSSGSASGGMWAVVLGPSQPGPGHGMGAALWGPSEQWATVSSTAWGSGWWGSPPKPSGWPAWGPAGLQQGQWHGTGGRRGLLQKKKERSQWRHWLWGRNMEILDSGEQNGSSSRQASPEDLWEKMVNFLLRAILVTSGALRRQKPTCRKWELGKCPSISPPTLTTIFNHHSWGQTQNLCESFISHRTWLTFVLTFALCLFRWFGFLATYFPFMENNSKCSWLFFFFSFSLYKDLACEMGFEEFHLYLRPVHFESASHKDKVVHPPPVFITSLLEDNDCIDRWALRESK